MANLTKRVGRWQNRVTAPINQFLHAGQLIDFQIFIQFSDEPNRIIELLSFQRGTQIIGHLDVGIITQHCLNALAQLDIAGKNHFRHFAVAHHAHAKTNRFHHLQQTILSPAIRTAGDKNEVRLRLYNCAYLLMRPSLVRQGKMVLFLMINRAQSLTRRSDAHFIK